MFNSLSVSLTRAVLRAPQPQTAHGSSSLSFLTSEELLLARALLTPAAMSCFEMPSLILVTTSDSPKTAQPVLNMMGLLDLAASGLKSLKSIRGTLVVTALRG